MPLRVAPDQNGGLLWGRGRLQFRSKMIAPPADAAGLVNTFYVIETGDGRIEEPIPAYSAQIIVVVRGQLTFTFADGSTAQSSTITINAPQMRSAGCLMEGPVLEVGASLTHASWQRLANLPADTVHDQLIPAETILTAAQIAGLEAAAAACAQGLIAPEDLCVHLTEVIAAAPHSLRPDHAAVVEAILSWLASGFDPAVRDLYASVNVSSRQLQRICRRFFGVAPAQVLKRFRALRAAMLLTQPGISEEVHAQVMATYFDQAHLIRDIRRYTGRTPTQFQPGSPVSGLLDPAAHGEAGALMQSADD